MEQCNHGGVKRWCPVCNHVKTPKKNKLNLTSEYQKCDSSGPEVLKAQGNLMARVFLRNTGALTVGNNYKISKDDLFAWFENADYLRSYTEYDTL